MKITTFLLVAAQALSVFAATSCTNNAGIPGTCISTSSCSGNGGSSEAGHCPGASNIQCCTYGTCTKSGQSGLCISTSACSSGGGSSKAGLCPGPADIQCCTYGSCTAGGSSGTCEVKSACSGTLTANKCPGPANIQCCTSGSGGGSCGPSAVNSATLALVQEFEGWSANPYNDPAGYPTIGYGHLCSSSSCSEIPYSIPLSKANGAKLLQSDMLVARKCISSQINDNIKLNPNQYGALCSWAFNVGCGNSASSTLIKRLNNGETPNTVAAEELPRWNKAGGEVLAGLTRRRAAEVSLFKTASSGVAHPPSC